MFILRSFLILSFIIFFFSCAKENDYKPVFKESEVVDKAMIADLTNPGKSITYNKLVDGDDPKNPRFGGLEETIADNVYLYIPTVETGSYYSANVMPYHVGEEKLVQFEFTKSALKVYGHEKDKRFQGEGSKKPILEIPVEHVDYRCRENSNDECSNEEEENNDISWKAKKYVQLDFEKIKVTEFDSSAGFYQELINQFYGCSTTESVRVKSWNITKDSVDLIVERTMKQNIKCMNLRTDDLSSQSYKIDHHYQFKKLNSIASHDYEPALYAKADEDTFGFFKSGFKTLSADNQELYYSEQVFMNRFNPKKKVITYHLSENHFDGEFGSILDATKKAIEVVNDGLDKAGTGMKVELSTTTREDNIHNIQNSIIMVKEPFKAGPLGYGPSIKNPINGEILQAQTVMYYGNMLWTIRSAYNDLIAAKLKQIQADSKPEEETQTPEKAVEQSMVPAGFSELESQRELQEYVWANISDGVFDQDHIDEFSHAYDQFRAENFSNSQMSYVSSRSARLNHNFTSLKEREEIFSRHNLFSSDYINIDEMIKEIATLPEMDGGLAPWMYLSDNQKAKVIDLMIPKLWIPVLIHELGHNLGLRHNFSGSEDKANFYSDKELLAMGVDLRSDKERESKEEKEAKFKIPYSSVMDYTHSDINALPVLGKYDVAALQFGYARKLNNQDGTKQDVGVSMQVLADASKEKLSAYKYCSDEGVTLNASCNRFDEGTNLTEIAEFYVRNYKKNLSRLNTKQDRLLFSAYDNFSHLRRKYYRTFFNLRKFYDTYERLHYQYVVPNPANAANPYIIDSKKSVGVVADFLIDVLKTPEPQCHFRDKRNPERPVDFWIPLKNVNYTSCSAFPGGENYELLGYTSGQLLQDAKTAENTNTYVDQIDIRGFWMDKFLALDTLLKRKHGITSFDRYTENFVTMGIKLSNGKIVDAAIKEYLNELIDGKAKKEMTVTRAGGKEKVVQLIDSTNEQFIPDSVSSYFNSVMGLKRGKAHMSQVLVESILENFGPFDNVKKNKLTKDYLVYTDSFGLKDPQAIETKFGNFYFEKDNELLPSLMSKIEVSGIVEDLGKGKNPDVIAGIAELTLKSKDVDNVMANLKSIFKKEAEALYNNPALKVHFDGVAAVPQAELKDYLAEKFENVSEENKKLLDAHKSLLGTDVVIIAASQLVDDEKTGIATAQQYYFTSRIPEPETYRGITESFVTVKSEAVLKSVSEKTLNTKEHYEKVISALSLVNKDEAK